MKFVSFLIFFYSFLFSYSSYMGNGFYGKDLKILNELDIKSEFITDYKLQKLYKYYIDNYDKRYAKKLNEAYMFVPEIKKILLQNKIPTAFLYLAMAESEFSLDAKSYKKAGGTWQFIPSTAKKFGLIIDDYVDERLDIIKSTKAAAEYLKYLHNLFGKWYMVALAYNCGEARLTEGITRVMLDKYCKEHKGCKKDENIKKYRKIIKLYQRKKIKFSKLNKIYKKIKKLGYSADIDDLLVLQKGLRRQYTPKESRNYIRKIIVLAMMNNSNILLKNENIHLLNRGIASPIATVDIKGGILLKDVAKLIGVDKKELIRLNPHIKMGIIPPYKKVYSIHIPYTHLARFNANKNNIKSKKYDFYIVKKGDSLYKIAKIYGINYKIIKDFNHLKSNILSINQKLIIPIDKEMVKKPFIYIVKKGDSLYKIAKKHKISVSKISKDNRLKTDILHIGDKLVINYY